MALEGPLVGKRNHTLLMLACEAVVSGERDEKKLVRFLLSVPRPHSRTPQAEHAQEARAAAKGALRLYAANDPRSYSSCPHVPRHGGEPTASQHRSTYQHACAPERAASCPIHKRWQHEQNLPAYQHIIISSIWRDGRGNGAGFGSKGKEVYKIFLRFSGGEPERVFAAADRYIAINLPNDHVRRRDVPKIVDALVANGLVELVQRGAPPDRPSTYRVPYRPPAWISELEAKLGTDRLERNARNEILRDWHKAGAFQPEP